MCYICNFWHVLQVKYFLFFAPVFFVCLGNIKPSVLQYAVLCLNLTNIKIWKKQCVERWYKYYENRETAKIILKNTMIPKERSKDCKINYRPTYDQLASWLVVWNQSWS